jgi:hypothetical protein
MHPITVRQATIADLGTLLGFEQGVVHAERACDAALKEEVIHYYDIEKLLKGENAIFLVAQSGREIIGCGFARVDAAKPHFKHAQQASRGTSSK